MRVVVTGAMPAPCRFPPGLLRGAAAASLRLGLQPSPEGRVDLALGVPVLDTTRARTELGWRPTVRAGEARRELLEGLADGASFPPPALSPEATVPRRGTPDA